MTEKTTWRVLATFGFESENDEDGEVRYEVQFDAVGNMVVYKMADFPESTDLEDFKRKSAEAERIAEKAYEFYRAIEVEVTL